MSSIVIAGDTSGSVTLAAPAVSGSTTLTLPATSATLATLTTPSFATTIGVGGATASASGSGITFPATVSGSSNANTLDDYEEGTWTPSLGGNATYAIQTGMYVKVGTLVTINFRIDLTTLGTGSATTISGMPFNVTNAVGGGSLAGSIGYWGSTATSISSCQLTLPSTTQLSLQFTTGNQSTCTYNGTFFANGTSMWATASYMTT